MGRGEHRHRLRPHQRVQALAQPVLGEVLHDIDMRGHRQRMNAGIGAPGSVRGRQLAGHAVDRLLERLLD